MTGTTPPEGERSVHPHNRAWREQHAGRATITGALHQASGVDSGAHQVLAQPVDQHVQIGAGALRTGRPDRRNQAVVRHGITRLVAPGGLEQGSHQPRPKLGELGGQHSIFVGVAELEARTGGLEAEPHLLGPSMGEEHGGIARLGPPRAHAHHLSGHLEAIPGLDELDGARGRRDVVETGIDPKLSRHGAPGREKSHRSLRPALDDEVIGATAPDAERQAAQRVALTVRMFDAPGSVTPGAPLAHLDPIAPPGELESATIRQDVPPTDGRAIDQGGVAPHSEELEAIEGRGQEGMHLAGLRRGQDRVAVVSSAEHQTALGNRQCAAIDTMEPAKPGGIVHGDDDSPRDAGSSGGRGWPALFGLSLILPGLAALGLWLGGAWTWALPAFTFGLVPLLELVWTGSQTDPTAEDSLRMPTDFARELLEMILGLAQLGVMGMLAYRTPELQGWSLVGAVFSVGICAGAVGINLAHELGHRQTRRARWMARALLTTSLYSHFTIEHNQGHHVRVATPDDPATSRRGESLYAFWPRTLWGCLLHGWKLEAARLARSKRHAWSPRNRVLMGLIVQAGWLGALALLLSPTGAAIAAIAALCGALLLETTNYFQHYGLVRARDANGRWERVTAAHVWTGNHPMSRGLLLDLPRHTDHHLHPGRPCAVLRHNSNSPQLPTGYPGMVLLALVPPLFRRVMHRIIDAHGSP